jgi:hypothetical protein
VERDDFKSKFPQEKVRYKHMPLLWLICEQYPALEHGDVKVSETIAVAYVCLAPLGWKA